MAKDAKRRGKPTQYELQAKPTKGDTALETADFVVTAVASAASMSAIPLLGEAAGLVQEVLTIIQDIQDNKEQYVQLAQHVSQLVARAAQACEPYRLRPNDLPPNLLQDLQTLVRVLRTIKEYSLKKANRGWVQRIIFRRHDEQVIRNYSNELKHHLDLFNLAANLELRQGQADIIKRLDAQQTSITTLDTSPNANPYYYPYQDSSAAGTADAYSPASQPDWPFGPGFPFNQSSSPVHQQTKSTRPPMVTHGDSFNNNSGNVVYTNVINSNNDYSSNVYSNNPYPYPDDPHYPQDYSRPRRGPTWKQYHR